MKPRQPKISFVSDPNPNPGPLVNDSDSAREAPSLDTSDGELLDAYSRAVAGVAERVGPAVVRVEVAAGGKEGRAGTGSGVIISSDGFVLTNSHVAHGAKTARLTTPEGQTFDARVI